MHFERCDGYMELELQRHPGARRDPDAGNLLDARVRGHDYGPVSTACQRSRVHNTL
jgi:hypothetical protein